MQVANLFNRPGYWEYVIDNEEGYKEHFNDKAEKPNFTPEGHWEWVPSLAEAQREWAESFRIRWMSLSEEEREKIRKENEAYLAEKGFKIPPYRGAT